MAKEGKEERQEIIPLRSETEEDIETLRKVLSPEGESEITIKGIPQKVWWARPGFDAGFFYRSFIKKQLRYHEELGSIEIFKHSEDLLLAGERKMAIVSKKSMKDGTLMLFDNGKLINGYRYDPLTQVIAFFKPIPESSKIKADYEYYDTELWEYLTEMSNTCVFIFLSIRKTENKLKKVFASPEEVASLDTQEITDILSQYTQRFLVKETELKNSSASLNLGENGHTPKDITSAPGELKSGEKSPEEMKAKA